MSRPRLSHMSRLSSRSNHAMSSPASPAHVARTHTRRPRTRGQLLLIGLLGLLVFAGLLSDWSLLVKPVMASSLGIRPSAPASNTFQQFLKEGQQSKASHGPLTYGRTLSKIPQPQNPTRYANLPPSAEPPTMQPITQALSTSFLQGGTTNSARPLDLLSSDGRLEVQVQPASFDVSRATVGAGASPSGGLSLRVSELRGYFVGQSVSLGSYQVQLVDSRGQVLSGVLARTPITIVYHYQPAQLSALGLDPGRVMLAVPDLIEAATQAKTSPAAYELLMQDDPTTSTLSAQSTVLGPHPFSLTEEPQNQSPPTLHLAAMQGNNGQLTYSYPLEVPPGPGGFAPQLQLAYSSAGPNERHVANNPAGDEGDGWSLSLGSISEETTSYGTFYFLNDVAGIGDRLVPTGSNNLYDTQHISYLRIQQVTGAGGQPCFDVWDKAGTFYEIGCTTNALQYWMDTSGTRHNYLWDVDKIIAPNEGPSASTYRLMLLSYVQDSTSNNGHTYVRDAALQQIIYGMGGTNAITTVVGTVDFTYHGPTTYSATSGDSSRNITWVSAYGTNYGCKSAPPVNTALRCDDPLNDGSSELAPLVMSTLTLDSVSSYVGSDAASGSSYEEYSYSLAYNSTPPPSSHDAPFAACTDPTSGAQEYCAGEHLLYSITPTIYQSNVGNTLHAIDFSYTGSTLQNTYYDSTEKVGTQQYQAQTNWNYLSAYEDLNSGAGGLIAWKTAYNNTDGTPDKYNGQGALIDNRYDPFYCDTYPSDCTGNYAHPDNHAWSEQVVVSISALGKDSSASTLQDASTTYSYLLAKTGTYQSGSQYCYPSGSDSDCVGDNWIPTTSTTDWKDYYDAEYQGFAQVLTTSPAGDLTVGKYYSTDGWYQPWSDYNNFLGANLSEEDIYSGTSTTASTLLSTTANTYATGTNACRSTTPTYPACEAVLTSTSTTVYNQAQHETPVSVTHTYTYDDYTTAGGLSSGYHNLTQDAVTTSTVSGTYATQSYTYATDNQTVTGPPSWTYYTVDTVATGKLVDGSGHTWNCQNITYDENAPSGTKIPAQGLPTTSTSYANCAAQTGPVTTYSGYDKFGNTVASVDGVASANSSLYSSSGCTLGTSPYIYSSAWGKSHYTACSSYDATYNTLPVTQSNALGQSTTLGYTSEDVLASVKDANNQTTSDSYSYSSGNATLQVSQPGETNSYTTRSASASSCTYNTSGNVLPCFEIDNNSYLYNSVKSSTFYDALGRATETRTPGPGSGYDTIVMTVYNDALHTSWQSVPFEVTHGSGWVDPNGAKDYQGVTPGGTTTFYDALGRAIASQDPLYGTGSDGVACSATLTGTYTACVNYSLGTVSGDSNGYATATAVDADNHLSIAFSDGLGRTIYTQQFSGTYTSGTYSLNAQTTIAYNVLGEQTSLAVTDEAPQSGQSITSVTTTAQYDDLGRMTQLVDPDRGTHTYSYDADGRVLSDVSGTRTLGYSYDLLGRVGCVQNLAPTESATGACTSGATQQYLVNTYDTSTLGTQGSTDFPLGQLTKSVATTYYPDSSATGVTQLYQHDQRGQLITEQLSFSLPGSWNVTSGLPTYQLAQSYNDAHQPTTTTTTSSTPAGQGTTSTQVYDSTSGVLTGLSNNGTASADLATLVYDARAQLDTISFQTSSGGSLMGEQFGYDATLRTTSATATWQGGSGNSGTAFSQTLAYDAASNLTSLSTTQAAVPGQSNSGGSETQVFCYDE